MTKINVIEALKKSRQKVCDLGDGKKVLFSRPPEIDFVKFIAMDAGSDKVTWRVPVEDMKKYVTGWDGFTEATFLPAGVGGSDPEPFSAELFSLWIDDHVIDAHKVCQALIDAMVAYIEAKEKASGN